MAPVRVLLALAVAVLLLSGLAFGSPYVVHIGLNLPGARKRTSFWR